MPEMQDDREDNTMERERGQKPGNNGWRNRRIGSKGKDKKLSGMDLEQEGGSEDIDADREDETPGAPPQSSHPLPTFRVPSCPSL